MTERQIFVIILSGMGIRVLFNYWEHPPSKLPEVLGDLASKGLTELTAFIPWQLFESDISHSLSKFLEAASLTRIRVCLIATPELGVHVANSGIPKDLVSRADHLAQQKDGKPFFVAMAPRVFALPSFLNPEVLKRYGSFLARLNVFFNDLSRTHYQALRSVRIELSGGLWKYYRDSRSGVPFEGGYGDLSKASAIEFRKALEEFYGGPEFLEPDPSSGNKWKNRGFDELNLKWFFSQCEESFRIRSNQMLSKNQFPLAIQSIELFTPESDPSLLYAQALQLHDPRSSDFFSLSQMLDAYAVRRSHFDGGSCAPICHWTSIAGLRNCSDAERQFLILKSLLLFAGQGGALLVDSDLWFELSSGFRTKAESMARYISDGGGQIRFRAAYLTPCLWDSVGSIGNALHFALGSEMRIVSTIVGLQQDAELKLVVLDPDWFLTDRLLKGILALIELGKVVAIPKTALMSERSRLRLSQVLSLDPHSLHVKIRSPFLVSKLGEGKLIVYEVPQNYEDSEALIASWVSLTGLEQPFDFSDSRLKGLLLAKKGERDMGLFILNSASKKVQADLLFKKPLIIKDLGSQVLAGPRAEINANEAGSEGDRFGLEVPPGGVVPLLIEPPVEKIRKEPFTDHGISV